MKYIGFNVNGIRARLHQLETIEAQHQPDVLALQEIKVEDAKFPHEDVTALGFPHHYIFGQKSHYGVALLSKTPLQDVQLGFPWREPDQQRRIISATHESGVRLLNGYFPQGEARDHAVKFPAKREYYADVLRLLEEFGDPNAPLLLTGDMNVAPSDQDIGIGEDNKNRWLRTGKTSFLPEEREWLERLMQWGLTDTYVAHTPDDERLYSWFDYRSRGFERDPKRGLRIDLMLASAPVAAGTQSVGIDYDIRGSEKPSDHCPIWCEFSL